MGVAMNVIVMARRPDYLSLTEKHCRLQRPALHDDAVKLEALAG
jgi:hypothetical protein